MTVAVTDDVTDIVAIGGAGQAWSGLSSYSQVVNPERGSFRGVGPPHLGSLGFTLLGASV